jgi:hypothetical protein
MHPRWQVTSLLYHADKQSKAKDDSGIAPVSLSDFDINNKLGDLKVGSSGSSLSRKTFMTMLAANAYAGQ